MINLQIRLGHISKLKKKNKVTDVVSQQASKEAIQVPIKVLEDEKPAKSPAMLSIEDLAQKVEKEISSSQVAEEIVEIQTIDNPNVWSELIPLFPKGNVNMDYIKGLEPEIKNDTFVFNVSNTIQEQMVRSCFGTLKQIYFQTTSKNAGFDCIVNESLVETFSNSASLSKTDKFNALAKKNPLLNKLLVDFGLDLYD